MKKIQLNIFLGYLLLSLVSLIFISIYVFYQILNQLEEIPFEYKQSLNFNFIQDDLEKLIEPTNFTKIKKFKYKECSIKKCFNLTKCNVNNFKLYVYDEPFIIKSYIYKNIINILKKSEYITDKADEACIFIMSIDTLDRDKLSSNYVKDIELYINNLKYWRNGENHLLFNLYSGSWPDYIDSLEFDIGNAILIKASFSFDSYRKNFDVSFPLFHFDLPFNNSLIKTTKNFSHLINGDKKYFLTFKGKRYLNGVGSETRNSLYHLNNKRDIILLTTCKHGLNWEFFKDNRCKIDNLLYDKYDYNYLLYNSIFCLVPRGRRLGTYRFLEALKSGCIPVILSNSWVLPFSEILNWNKAVVWADEKKLTQITSILRDISNEKINQMRKYCLLYFDEYFSSIERIINTTLNIIKLRIQEYQVQ